MNDEEQQDLVSIDGRLLAPDNLTDRQAEIWKSIINSRQGDYFKPEHIPMLTQLCRHIEMSDFTADAIAQFDKTKLSDPNYIKAFNTLSAAQDRESREISALMRSMRLTHQSVYNALSANTAAKNNEGADNQTWNF